MHRFKDILCVVVPDADNGVALARAAAIVDNNQARLTVVDIINDIPPILSPELSPEVIQELMVNEHQQGLQKLTSSLPNDSEIQTKVLNGIPFLEIIKEVLHSDRDIVIKTAEKSGLLDRVFGSGDMHLLRKCPCPVWLVQTGAPKVYKRIVAAIDVDDNYPVEELNTRRQLNIDILEMACSLAISEFAELHIIHVWRAAGESELRDGFIKRSENEIVAYVEEIRQRHERNFNLLINEIITKLELDTSDYLKPQTHLIKGSPRNEISAFAKEIEADLVIMGTVARTGISGLFMGNTAETILNKLNCSVLAIKPPGFKTPVVVKD